MIGLGIAITVGVFFAMEWVAWATHKYVMHGFLWYLHQDHHVRENKGFFEKNDAFFVIFAVPGSLLTIWGQLSPGWDVQFFIGLGITFYGFAYFLVHEVFIHQRFRWFKKAKHPYFKAIKDAHHQHHKHLGKEHGECFGMLWAPREFFRQAYAKK